MSTSRTAPRITICGIPELGEYSAAGVTHVVSILGPNSPDPPEFAAFAPHRRLILRFHDVIEPQPDQIAPTREDVDASCFLAERSARHRRLICSCIVVPGCRALRRRRR
jgi:predicted protein tyrosine phosphatase